MNLHVFTSRTRALGSKAELQALQRALTFPLAKRGGPKHLPLFDLQTQSFPTGLLSDAVAALRVLGLEVAVTERRPAPTARSGHALAWLDAHQRTAIDALIGARWGCADMPTASGKGEVIAALTADLAIPWIVLCDDQAVFSMLSDAETGRIVLRTGEVPGQIGAGTWQEARVIVASLQSLDPHFDGQHWSPRALAMMQSRRGRIYDEVHMSASERSQRVLQGLAHCEYSIGLSATLTGRSDKRDPLVRAAFGPSVFHLSTLDMESIGRTTERRILFVRCDQPRTARYDAGGYRAAICLSKPRNQLVAAIMRKWRHGGLVYVRELPHLAYLLQIAKALDLRAAAIHGETSPEERRIIVERFENADLDVLFATDAFRQGADVIHVRWGCNAAGNKSPIATIQRGGRSARVCRLPITDCPNCQRFGHKGEEAIPWFDFWDTDSAAEQLRSFGQTASGLWLRDHSTERLEAYREKGLSVKLITAAEI